MKKVSIKASSVACNGYHILYNLNDYPYSVSHHSIYDSGNIKTGGVRDCIREILACGELFIIKYIYTFTVDITTIDEWGSTEGRYITTHNGKVYNYKYDYNDSCYKIYSNDSKVENHILINRQYICESSNGLFFISSQGRIALLEDCDPVFTERIIKGRIHEHYNPFSNDGSAIIIDGDIYDTEDGKKVISTSKKYIGFRKNTPVMRRKKLWTRELSHVYNNSKYTYKNNIVYCDDEERYVLDEDVELITSSSGILFILTKNFVYNNIDEISCKLIGFFNKDISRIINQYNSIT